jgi:phosphomannomutase
MIENSLSMNDLFARLPKRYSRAALLKHFPRSASLEIISMFSPEDARIKEVRFQQNEILLIDENGQPIPGSENTSISVTTIREQLQGYFKPDDGFSDITRLNYTDGVRVYFSNGDVAHVRPSGNADELRIYAVADKQSRADEITAKGIAEPQGILRSLEHALLK